jgi:hypothetical protein
VIVGNAVTAKTQASDWEMSQNGTIWTSSNPLKNELDCTGMWDEDIPLNIFYVARTHIPFVNQEYEQRQGVKQHSSECGVIVISFTQCLNFPIIFFLRFHTSSLRRLFFP